MSVAGVAVKGVNEEVKVERCNVGVSDKDVVKADKDVVSLYTIDGFWEQRHVPEVLSQC